MDDFKIKGENNPKIISLNGEDKISFKLSKSDLKDPDEFESFIKSCEQMIRDDPRYTAYISELKSRGFNKDVMQSGINNDLFPSTSIEMHHGPIFNLFELCSIVTDYLLKNDEKVTTYNIADTILEEHKLNNIQVTFLTKTNHELVHNGDIFIHINQTFGNILNFISKYKSGLHKDHLSTFNRYIELCEKYDATDNDYLQLSKLVKEMNK